MDNNKNKDPASLVDGWMDEILARLNLSEDTTAVPEEIGPDESAVSSAGLTHPDDLELERIVQATLAENWGFIQETSPEPEPESDADKTMFFAPQQPQREEKKTEPARKKPKEAFPEDKLRPKAKKGYGLLGIPHIIATLIWLCIIAVIGVSLGKTLWVCAADLLALGKEGKKATITIEVSDKLPDIAEKLEEAGMIRYPNLFELFAKFTGKGDSILTGEITFKETTVYDYNALINAMSFRGGALKTVEVMIPEGYSCAQIFKLLEEKGVCKASELEDYAANGELESYWFLDGIERGHKYSLEGFLFPDTYEFYVKDEPRRVLEKFLNNFKNKFSDLMIDKYVALNKATGLNLSIYEVVIMASMVEKEKANNAEGYKIASVFYNRLTHAAKYPFLNSDATILYATDYRNKGELKTDAQINASPYNTYTQRGLPPTPIANPGLSSLDAALEPDNTGYYYFILDKAAHEHRFSKTLAEHEKLRKELGYIS